MAKTYHVYCPQCDALAINGVACHERGCPHRLKTWVHEKGFVIPDGCSLPSWAEDDNVVEEDEEVDEEQEPFTDVHTSHCCKEHGRCKYGEEEICTVVQGMAEPQYPCNCGHF